ncbi:MAG: hypothetical protein A4E48_00126 [Methanosaeta sp. PtaU1.Bin060]|nr:MAG: hypothetical protein A4E48_00126 [Methanosaeta sp. PtaU1.Bin060]
MSAVLDFFREHPQLNDDVHKTLTKKAGLEAQLVPIRQAMLGCCGAVPGKNGEVKLFVADAHRWDELAAQQAAIVGKLEAIDKMVEELDKIFAEIEEAGINCPDKTLCGIRAVEVGRRTPQFDPETGDRTDAFGHPIPAKHDEKALAWLQRAEEALASVGQI